MAIEKLSVILELVSGNYKKEARDAATATGQISGAAATADTSMGRMSGAMNRTAGVMKGIFAAAATGAVIEVIGDLDQLGQKMESTERMAETVFGNMVDQARDWADENNEAFGIGESAMLSLISKTQDLLVPMGFARDAAFDMSKEILNTANALSEWEGGTITAEDAQLRLAKAMLGEREGLVELGVKITDQEVKTRLAAKGLDKLTGAARQQAIAQVTLELVMGKSTDALAAYETRAGTATAAQKDLAASTADTSESWAELLRGPLDTAKGTLADVTDITQFLSEKMAENAGKTGEAAEETDGLVKVWGAAQPVMAAALDILGWLADKTEEQVKPTQDAQVAYQFMADTLRDDVVPAGYATITMLDNQNASHRNAAKAADTQRKAMIDLANAQADLLDPIGNVLRLTEELEDAQKNLADVQDDGDSTARDLALAAIEVEQAFLRLQGAGAALTPDQIQAFALVLIEDLGMSEEMALRTLEALNLLDGWTGTASFTLRMNEIASGGGGGRGGGNVNSLFDELGFDSGGIVPGPRGSRQLILAHGGETVLPTHRGGSFGGGSTTIVVQSPMSDFRSDLQYATILASVTNLVEGF